MKAWKLLLGAAVLAAAGTQADATVTLYLQQSAVNNGNLTQIGSGTTSYSYNNDYGAFSVNVTGVGSTSSANFFTQTLDVSASSAATLTVYLVNTGVTSLANALTSTFTANGYDVASVVESTYLNNAQIGSATFDSSNLGATLTSTSTSGVSGPYTEISKYVITTNAAGGTANSTINITTGAVPEPASWAMMLAGFGFIGFALRQRRRPAVSFG